MRFHKCLHVNNLISLFYLGCPFSITSRTTSTTRMATSITTTKVSTTTQATLSNMESTTSSRGILLTSNTKTRSTTQRIRPTRRTTPTPATSTQSRRSTTRSTRSTTQSTISTTQSTRSTTQSTRSTRLISTTTRSSKTIRPTTLSSRTTEANTKRIRTDMPTTEIVNTEASTILMTSLSTEKTAETTLLINAKPSTSLGILSPVTTLLTPQINMSIIPLTTLLPIVVGVAVLLVLAGMIIFFCCKRKRLIVTATSNMNNNKPTSSQNGQEPCKNAWSNSGPNLVANVLYAPGRFNDVDAEGEDETYNKLYFLPQKKSNKQNEHRNNYNHIEIANNIPIMFNEKEQVYNELYFSKESAKTNYKSSATSRNPQGAFKIKERIEKTRKNQTNFPKSANSLSHNDSNHALLNDEVNIYNVPYNL